MTKQIKSKYQLEIERVYNTTNSNLFINASAGSGKTTVLKSLAGLTPPTKKIIFLAFNKSVQEELRSKLPLHVDVSTLHAKAYGVLWSNVKMNVKLNELKNFIYCRQVIKRKFKDKKAENGYFFEVSSIINFMKIKNLEINKENIKKICENYGLSDDEKIILDVGSVMNFITREEQDLNQAKPLNIDFTDMLYLCATKVNPKDYPKYDVVMLDELQDVSDIQRVIALNLLKPNGRLIAVGDDKQLLYQFCGASLESLNVFKNRPNTISLPLPITYRCPKKIVELANTIFPEGTEAFESSEEGEIELKGTYLDAVEGDLIICRNNKPLISVWLDLMKAKKKAHIKGKDFGKNLQLLLTKLSRIEDTKQLLLTKFDDLKNKGIVNPNFHASYVDLEEKCQILQILYKEFKSLEKVDEVLGEVFSDHITNGIILSSIHKIKGGEANNVFIVNYDLIPSKYASTEEELYSEKCCAYVCLTRAKRKLTFCKIDL